MILACVAIAGVARSDGNNCGLCVGIKTECSEFCIIRMRRYNQHSVVRTDRLMAHIQRCPPSHPGYSQSVKHHARASFRTGPDKPRQIQKTYASDTAFEKLLVAKGSPRNFDRRDRKSTRLNSSHLVISYAVFCLKKKKKQY